MAEGGTTHRLGPPQLWMFAGPNGAGKSTQAARQVRGRLPIVNPDEIARTLPPGRDGGVDVLAAGRLAVAERERRVLAGESFAIETTLAGWGELSLVSRAKDLGYAVHLFYFERSRGNLAEALRLADRAHVLDNSGERRRLVLIRSGGHTRRVSTRVPAWVETHVPADLRDPAAP